MEGFIIFLIISVIGAIMNGNKNKQKSGMPPFNNSGNQRPLQDTFSEAEPMKPKTKVMTLDDFAKEIFEQMSSKKPENVFGEPIKEDMVEQKVEYQPPLNHNIEEVEPKIERETRPAFDVNRSTNANAKKAKKQDDDIIKQREIGSFIPTSRNELIQAIVTSEIIGPPKAKQR